MLAGPINSVAVGLRTKTRKHVPSLREERTAREFPGEKAGGKKNCGVV